MFFRSIIIYLLVSSSFLLFAHNGKITGKVKDKNGLGIANVSIKILNSEFSAYTNISGQFSIFEVPEGEYIIEASLLGYSTTIKEIIVKSDETNFLIFELDEALINLEEIKVKSSFTGYQQIISNLDIKVRPINNSQEVLRIIPGLIISQHAGGGKPEQLFLRGFDIDHGTDFQITADNIPVNLVSHAHGQGYADTHFIIPELIENVQFKKGMYDAEKGNFATTGWANFKTKTVLEDNFLKSEIGQFNSFRAVAGLNLVKTKKYTAYLASEYSKSDFWFDNPQNFDRFNVFGKYHIHITPKTDLTFTGSTFFSKWNATGQIPQRAVDSGLISFFGSIDPNEGGYTNRTNFNLELKTLTKKNKLWSNQIWFSNYVLDLFSNFTFFLNDTINGDQIYQAESRNLFGYNSNFTSDHFFFNKSSVFTAGVNIRQDLTKNSSLAHTKNRIDILEYYNLGDINENNSSIYFEENVKINTKFNAVLGLRADAFINQYTDKLLNNQKAKIISSIISPKLRVNYTLNDKAQLYLATGKGFHSNDTRVVVAQNGTSTLPAAYGADLGLIFKPFPKMVLNTTFWTLYLDQEFVYVGDEAVVEPSGRTFRKGFDLSLRTQLFKNLFFDLDLNSTKPRFLNTEKGNDFIPLAVPLSSSGGFTLKNQKGLNGSLRYRFISKRPANEDNSIQAEGYFISDANIRYDFSSFSVGLSIENIFNCKWKETQFATTSRLQNEAQPVEEIHFIAGTPFNAKFQIQYSF